MSFKAIQGKKIVIFQLKQYGIKPEKKSSNRFVIRAPKKFDCVQWRWCGWCVGGVFKHLQIKWWCPSMDRLVCLQWNWHWSRTFVFFKMPRHVHKVQVWYYSKVIPNFPIWDIISLNFSSCYCYVTHANAMCILFKDALWTAFIQTLMERLDWS